MIFSTGDLCYEQSLQTLKGHGYKNEIIFTLLFHTSKKYHGI